MVRNTRARGFTLIELMMVVAIIGVLASVAIPEFKRLTLRSKQAERRHVMNTIKTGIQDVYLQHGDLPVDPGSGQPYAILDGPWTPGWPPESLKRVPNWTQDDWNKIFHVGARRSGTAEIEGALYYSYHFTVIRGAGGNPAQIMIHSAGDLDGDLVPSLRASNYLRDVAGVFRFADDSPVGWMDMGVDDGTF
ncbi:MAG TPA: type II secretion system protein [Anaeromyxobacter sp.]|nr:type II secretion system protein [Anaeromyxobacter sp.]